MKFISFVPLALFSATYVEANKADELGELVLKKLEENVPNIDSKVSELVPAQFPFEGVGFENVKHGWFNIPYGYKASLSRVDHANTLHVSFNEIELESTDESITVTVGVGARFGEDLRIHGSANAFCGALSVSGDVHTSLEDLSLQTTLTMKLFLAEHDNLSVDIDLDEFKLATLDIGHIDFEWHLFGKKLWGWFDNMLDSVLNGVLHLVEGIKPSLMSSITKTINETVYSKVNEKAQDLSPEAFKLLFEKAHEYLSARRMLKEEATMSSTYEHFEEDRNPGEDVPQEFKDQFKRALRG